jgi:hypothetical protein
MSKFDEAIEAYKADLTELKVKKSYPHLKIVNQNILYLQ